MSAAGGPRRAAAIALVAVVVACGMTACGGDGSDTPVAAQPTSAAPAPSATSEIPTVATPTTTPSAPTTTTPPTATTGVPSGGTESEGGTGGEDQPGGAGDEEAIRVPATFVIDGAKVTPLAVAVPPFLPIELRLIAKDGRPHDIAVRGVPALEVRLAAGGTATRRIDGLKKGEYALVVDGAPSGSVLRVGTTQPGP